MHSPEQVMQYIQQLREHWDANDQMDAVWRSPNPKEALARINGVRRGRPRKREDFRIAADVVQQRWFGKRTVGGTVGPDTIESACYQVADNERLSFERVKAIYYAVKKREGETSLRLEVACRIERSRKL